MFRVRRLFRCGAISVSCILLAATDTYADVLSFFPSTQIHEDDGLIGEYELAIEDCRFEITAHFPTRQRPRFVKHTKIDLSDFITVPFLVGSGGSTVSARVIVAWFTESHVKSEVADLQIMLRETRVPLFHDRKNVSESDIAARRSKLRETLGQIEDGIFGEFAMRNHSAYYDVVDQPKLDSVTVADAFQLPAKGRERDELIQAVFEHQLENCPGIISSILDRLDGKADGKIDQFYLDKLNLDREPR